MKATSRICVFAASVFALAACGVGNHAHAQAVANSQVVVSATKTADISRARFVKLTVGAQTITDNRGVTTSIVLPSVSAVSLSEPFKSYLGIGSDTYINLRETVSVDCVGSNTVIDWITTGAQVVNDGCALNDIVKANARR